MSRQLRALSLDNLADLPVLCRQCVFWELDPVAGPLAADSGDAALEKEAWVSDTLLEWGTCGQLAYVDDEPAGYALYAPAVYVPRAAALPTAPASPDAVLLTAARVSPAFAGTGLGRALVRMVARDVAHRGIWAVEAFGRVHEHEVEPADDAAGTTHIDRRNCLLPAAYLRAVGFTTVRPHPHTPRLRLDVGSTSTLPAEREHAADLVLAGVSARPPEYA